MDEQSSQVTIDRVPDEPGTGQGDGPIETTPEPEASGSTANQSFAELPASPMRAMERLGGWKLLRSMRTAIWLLLALIIATIIPTFIPQRVGNPERVADWAAGNSVAYQIAERLKLFDVFVSPWYIAIYVSLLFVLVMCLIPRTQNFVRQTRRATARPTDGPLPNVPHEIEIETELPADEALERVRATLRRKRWRRGSANESGQLIAEKGSSREGGSLLFHWSFLLILGAFFVSRAFGFEGGVIIVEGDTFVEAPVGFDRYNPGWFGDASHREFEVRLEDFDVAFREDRSAADFVSTVTVIDAGEEIITKEVRVNDPLDYRGVKMYQMSFGWAARMVVKDSADAVVFDDFVPLFSGGPRNTWTGVAKIPSITPQAGLELFFFPDARVLSDAEMEQLGLGRDVFGSVPFVNASPEADSPAMIFREYRGDLGLDRPQDVNALDTNRLGDPVGGGIIYPEQDGFTTANGLTVEFPELKQYSTFRVKRDPGLWLALIAAIFVVTGLMASLYVSRRRLWVWSRVPAAANRGKAPNATLVTLGGLAYQRKDAFGGEFADLAERVRRDIDGTIVQQESSEPGSPATPSKIKEVSDE